MQLLKSLNSGHHSLVKASKNGHHTVSFDMKALLGKKDCDKKDKKGCKKQSVDQLAQQMMKKLDTVRDLSKAHPGAGSVATVQELKQQLAQQVGSELGIA